MNKIKTFTGRRVNPLDLHPSDICIEDIAHHLSNICRFTGACSEFYSVAQHSVLVSIYVQSRGGRALPALLHDAPEAYLCDLSHPVKHGHSMLGDAYRMHEDRLQEVVAMAFDLPYNALRSPEIRAADDALFGLEWETLMERTDPVIHINPLLPNDAKRYFLNAYNECAR